MEKAPITCGNLIVDLPVKIDRITELKIEQGLNNHAAAYITGILEEKEKIKAVYDLNIKTNIKIKVKTDNEEKVIFSGVPVKIDVKHVDSVYYLYLILNSYSILMDFKQKSRSFQNIQNSYNSLFKKIISENNGDLIDTATNGTVQKGPIIQYRETDWEFIKRIASHVKAKILPDVKSDSPKIYIGVNAGKDHDETNYNYVLEKNVKDYLEFQGNYEDCAQEDFISYSVKSTNDYEMGDKIKYKGTVFTVAEKVSELEKGILYHNYKLQKELKQGLIYNEKCSGLSIEGKVLAVEKDKLKVHLSIDESQSPGEAYWYTFDTSYTSEGSTGWYSMPQIGDSAELYIPVRDERQAYIKRINRTDGKENPKAQDPSTKYFGTNHGKEMKLAPNELTFSTVENVLFVKLTDESGVEITSNNDINIKSGGFVYGECKTVEMESKDKIILATRNANIIVDQIVHIK